MSSISWPITRLRPAVNAFCKSCIYDKSAGNGSWRQQVANCRSFSCPLYNVRPRCRSARGLRGKFQQTEKSAQIDVILTDVAVALGEHHV